MYNLKDKEGTIINCVAEDYFSDYDCRKLVGNIDFSVAIRKEKRDLFPETEYLLWAEAKQGKNHPPYESFIQLILTIGKERTMEHNLPPKFLGAFDAEKIAFIPYSAVMEVFSIQDFNWNVTPSNHETKEFKLLKELVSKHLEESGKQKDNVFVFYYDESPKELKQFIRRNFVTGRDSIQRMRITHNNFKAIYEKWRLDVMPSINVNWENAKKHGLLDSDFYLADVMSGDNNTLLENLHVLLQSNHYELDRHIDTDGLFSSKQVAFKDNMQAHSTFWAKYTRPPKHEYWDKIVDRKDLLVPQDIRERKGSYYTPAIWVEKSQEYLADVLGENWQEEYYIWDCCAGTGNLLAGLTNKYNIWASELFESNVKIMHERIEQMGNGSNLLKSHVFQFDFLNDDFSKLPQGLQEIIEDPEKRKRLVIYINPPYAEVSSIKGGKKGVNQSSIHEKYTKMLGTAGREVYTQFLIRIFCEMHDCIIAEFSKLKTLQGAAFDKFRSYFKARLCRMFIVPGDTFDNVKGQFPIGFKVWDTSIEEAFTSITTDVFDAKGNELPSKVIAFVPQNLFISNWVSTFKGLNNGGIGFLCGTNGNDFQHNNIVYILNKKEQMANPRGVWITEHNLIESCIYFSVRKAIDADWRNDRDQFLVPSDEWRYDLLFHSDCLAYTLFETRISEDFGINHWIPFTEQEVDAPDNFKSHFMSDYIAGKIKADNQADLFVQEEANTSGPIVFSPAAADVMEAGRKIWYYYLHHKDSSRELYAEDSINVNASFYDIRAYFQGRDEKGKMNNASSDEEYMRLLQDLRAKQKVLAKRIEQKVYEYGFLK